MIRSIKEVESGTMNNPLVKPLIKSAGLHNDQQIQVKSNKGAVVIVNRTTLPELKAIMELN